MGAVQRIIIDRVTELLETMPTPWAGSKKRSLEDGAEDLQAKEEEEDDGADAKTALKRTKRARTSTEKAKMYDPNLVFPSLHR